MINRAQQRCQNMDKEGVPSSSGIDIIDEETESDEYECASAAAKSWNPHLLPCVCIIC